MNLHETLSYKNNIIMLWMLSWEEPVCFIKVVEFNLILLFFWQNKMGTNKNGCI